MKNTSSNALIIKAYIYRYSIIFILLLLFSTGLSAQVKDPADSLVTIYTENSLQAGLGYFISPHIYMGGVIPPGEGTFEVGDSYDSIDSWGNESIRAYLSFPIEYTPGIYQVESVTFWIYQRYCRGNNSSNVFPVWFDGDYYPCLVAHVDYGNSFEYTDFTPSEVTEIGVISTNNEQRFRQLDITESYLADLNAGKQYCQLMLYFSVLSDYDLRADWIMFDNSYTSYAGNEPKLIIHYRTTANADELQSPAPQLSVYPNPLHASQSNLTVKFKQLTPLPHSSRGGISPTFEIYNIRGQKVKSFTINAEKSKSGSASFNLNDLASEVYVCVFTNADLQMKRKITIIR